MSTLGHVAVGLAAGRWQEGRQPSLRRLSFAMAVFTFLALLPDADLLLPYGVGYRNDLTHRGASHSLFVGLLVGGLISLLVATARKEDRRGRVGFAILGAFVMASHGVLDAVTAAPPGPELLWPISDARVVAPWGELPMAPVGWGLLSAGGIRLAILELAMFLPFWAYALWPRRNTDAARNPGR